MGVVFRHTVEALVTHVERKGSMGHERLKELGVYPPHDVSIETWVQAVRAVAASLFPDQTAEAQSEALGRDIVRSFAQGVVGRGLMLVLRMAGRRRALLRMAENFKTADSVMDVTATARGDRWVRIRFGQIFGLEHHMHGVIDEGMKLASPREPFSIEGHADALGGYSFDVKW